MTDVDCFKAYNDHYGHGAGDECLKAVAWALSSSLARPADMMARYGGEEFVAILPETDTAGARLLAQRWCDTAAALALPHACSSVADHVTVSVGYACLTPTPEQSPRSLQELAHNMLYHAKKQGRNRISGPG